MKLSPELTTWRVVIPILVQEDLRSPRQPAELQLIVWAATKAHAIDTLGKALFTGPSRSVRRKLPQTKAKITRAVAECLRTVTMKRPWKVRSLGKARAQGLVDLSETFRTAKPGYPYQLTAKGLEVATAHVGCPCGWWQSSKNVNDQEQLEKNLAQHERDCREAKAGAGR